MSRFISLSLSLLVVLGIASVSFAGGSFNIGSVGSGSSSSSKDKPETGYVCRRSVTLGKVTVLVPYGDDDHENIQMEDGSWVFESHGRQVLCTEIHDVFAALRITNVETGSIGDWTYRWGSMGNSVVYVAASKKVPNVYVQGTTDSETSIKEVLQQVQVVKPKEVKDAKDVKQSPQPKPTK